MRNILFVIIIFCVFDLQAEIIQESPEVAELFGQAGVNGTFVLYETNSKNLTVFNPERAKTRFLPASTFKIPNSLIGLASGAVESVDEVLPYGGKPQYLKTWEQDMGLRDAIKISNVPIYQELARRIGQDRMAEYVRLLGYGNAETGDTVDMFWLTGPLEISAIEQSRFLARLAMQTLPVAADAQADVREIIKTDQGDGWTLYAKTGWAVRDKPAIGWWVGWVEKQGRIYSFALNIDMPGEADAKKRKTLGMASLKVLGVIQ